jgi:hypothetical protein
MPARAFTALGGLALLASLFLPWYSVLSAWQSFQVADVLLGTLALAIVAFAFRRFPGPATVFAALAAVIVAVKLVWRPEDLGTSYGVWIALAAALAALVGARGIAGRA